MGIRTWLNSGAVAAAAALIVAPVIISSTAFGAAPSSPTYGQLPFSDPSLNQLAEHGCYEYPDSTITDAIVERADKSWGNEDTLDPYKRDNWLTVTQQIFQPSAQVGPGDPGNSMLPCVVVRGDDHNQYSRELKFRTFNTEGDTWAALKQSKNQSVDVFVEADDVPAGSDIYVTGTVRSQNPREFVAGKKVPAQQLAQQNGVTLKAPMKIDDYNDEVTLHFSEPGFYVVTWRAEMNLGANTILKSSQHQQMFKVIAHDDSPILPPGTDPDPSVDPDPTNDPGTPGGSNGTGGSGSPVAPNPGGSTSNNSGSTQASGTSNNIYNDAGHPARRAADGTINSDEESVSDDASDNELEDEAMNDAQGLTEAGVLNPDAFPSLDPEKQRDVASPQEASKKWANTASTSVLAAGAVAALAASGSAGILLLRKP